MRMRAARLKSGKTQEQVAKEANISDRAYQNYEYDMREPSVRTAIRIADALGVENIRELFGAATPNEDPPGGNRADQENTQNHDSMTGVPGQDQ